MRILQRYIGSTVITTILTVVLVLTSLEIFIEFTNEFSDMGAGSYGFLQILGYVGMRLPADIYQFFPMAGLLGSLIGLGLLASRSELIVMRASGVSIAKITWAVIKAAFLIMIVAVFLGEGIGPFAQHTATSYKTKAMTNGQAIYTKQGTWMRDGQDFMHIANIEGERKLENITRFQFDDKRNLRATSFAKQGIYKHGKWTFKDIDESIFSHNKITNKHYAEQQWKLNFNSRLLSLVNLDSDQRSLPQLYSYIHYLHANNLQANRYEFNFWQRIFQPLATLVMILLSIPFIFGPLRTVTMGVRIVAGITTGAAFYLVNQFIEPISTVYQLPPLIVASVPIALIAILGIILIHRGK
jgi:lipopolysaccharide export system permease protein